MGALPQQHNKHTQTPQWWVTTIVTSSHRDSKTNLKNVRLRIGSACCWSFIWTKHNLNLMCLSMLIAVMRVVLLSAYCCDTPPQKQNGLSAKNVDWKCRLCEWVLGRHGEGTLWHFGKTFQLAYFLWIAMKFCLFCKKRNKSIWETEAICDIFHNSTAFNSLQDRIKKVLQWSTV